MRECESCGSLLDRDNRSGHCSLEPAGWDDSLLVRHDALRRRSGLGQVAPAVNGLQGRFAATPAMRAGFYQALLALSAAATTRVVSSDTRKIYGHSVDTDPEARVHWRVRGLTVCGREARKVLHTADQSAVTCKQCTFEV